MHGIRSICQAYAKLIPSLFRAYSKHIPSICQAYAKHMPSLFQAYSKHMPSIVLYVRRTLGTFTIFCFFSCCMAVPDLICMEIRSICQAYAKLIPSLFQTYSKHIPSICQAYAKHMPSLCQAYSKHMPSIVLYVRRTLGTFTIFWVFSCCRAVPDLVCME
jgi:hypothetical protein